MDLNQLLTWFSLVSSISPVRKGADIEKNPHVVTRVCDDTFCVILKPPDSHGLRAPATGGGSSGDGVRNNNIDYQLEEFLMRF